MLDTSDFTNYPVETVKRKHKFSSFTAYVKARTDRGDTLKEIAAELEMGVGYLADIKNGRTTPGFKLAKRLSDDLSIPLESFLEASQ